MIFKRNELLLLCETDPNQIIDIIFSMADTIKSLQAQIQRLEARIKDLERQIGLNSNNSSKPPSNDPFRKPKSMRKSGRKKGAPKGHIGHTMFLSDEPDIVFSQSIDKCPLCFGELSDVYPENIERRQVIDIIMPQYEISEHQIEHKRCPNCGTKSYPSFHEGLNAPVQFGPNMAAFTTYLNVEQMIPLNRIQDIYSSLYELYPSEATLLQQIQKTADQLKPCNAYIRKSLLKSNVIHSDETGMRINKSNNWIHTVSNSKWTLYHVDEKRGREAFDRMKVLPNFKGIVVHDCFPSYFDIKASYDHALCNAHLIRECNACEEYDNQVWPSKMKKLLTEAWSHMKKHRENKEPIKGLSQISKKYDQILQSGIYEIPENPINTGKRGRRKKSKAENLLQRFIDHKESILRFLYNDKVPFDNNQAERDLRMIKVKQKVSGCFRTQTGADNFATIRGVISSLKKQGLNVLESLTRASLGHNIF